MTKYTAVDSWLYWSIPSDLTDATPEEAILPLFKENYEPGFPSDIDKAALDQKLSTVQYVFIGLNPGDAGPLPELFGNFHGDRKSCDYRLAAITYGTAAWGGFITDLEGSLESDSSKVKVGQANVTALLNHLKDLGIPQSATLIALGSKVYKALEGNLPAGYHLSQLMHYSGMNGHWRFEKERKKVRQIIEAHTAL